MTALMQSRQNGFARSASEHERRATVSRYRLLDQIQCLVRDFRPDAVSTVSRFGPPCRPVAVDLAEKDISRRLAHDHRPLPMQIDPGKLPAVILVHRGLLGSWK